MQKKKRCNKCKVKKSLTQFYRHPLTKDGHFGRCKTCHDEASTARQKRNRVGQAAYLRVYRRVRREAKE